MFSWSEKNYQTLNSKKKNSKLGNFKKATSMLVTDVGDEIS